MTLQEMIMYELNKLNDALHQLAWNNTEVFLDNWFWLLIVSFFEGIMDWCRIQTKIALLTALLERWSEDWQESRGGDMATGHGSDSNLGWPLSAMQHLITCLSNWAQPAPCFDIYLLCLFQGFYQGYWLMGGSWLVFNEVAGQCISTSNLWWYSVPRA